MSQNIRNQASRGDMTGRKKEKDKKKYEKELAQTQERMAIANAQEKQAKKTEVVDLTEKKPVVEKEPDVVELDGTPEAVDEVETTDDTIQEVVDQSAPQPQAVAEEEVQVAQKPKQLIRALYDMNNVTVGYGTDYSFEAGRKYKVAPNVAQHLSERDLVEVLG